jgi:hypothetical protein
LNVQLIVHDVVFFCVAPLTIADQKSKSTHVHVDVPSVNLTFAVFTDSASTFCVLKTNTQDNKAQHKTPIFNNFFVILLFFNK